MTNARSGRKRRYYESGRILCECLSGHYDLRKRCYEFRCEHYEFAGFSYESAPDRGR
jgi:hypothetical protein